MKVQKNPLVLKPLVIATLMTLGAGNASAIEFEVGDGWKGNWNTTLSYGAAWRATGQNTGLFTQADGARVGKSGGTGGNQSDSGNLNWNSGDITTSVFKFVTDVSIEKNGWGGLLRVKGWTDSELQNGQQRFGNQGQRPYYNGTTPGGVLSDNGLEMMSRYTGVKIMDAYVFGTFDLGERPMQVKIGNQVVNWGESVFLQGINVTSPVDLPALRRGAGTEIKEFLIPVGMVFANLGLPGGASLEGFWQYDWQRTVIDSCGTYFAPTEGATNSRVGNCNITTNIGPVSSVNNATAANVLNTNVALVNGNEPDKMNQFGLAFRMPIEALDTEFGLYWQQLYSRTPVISPRAGLAVPGPTLFVPNSNLIAGVNPATGQPIQPYRGLPASSAQWDYPDAKPMQIFAITAATTLGGWSVGSELSYTRDVPVQVNGNDLVVGFLAGVGPYGPTARKLAGRTPGTAATTTPNGSQVSVGTSIPGYDLFDRTSFQFNGVKLFSDVLGAQNLTVIGEAGFQWNNLPDNDGTNVRYGRGFIYGVGSYNNSVNALGMPAIVANTCSALSPSTFNPQVNGCQNDGYFTDFSWGTRIRAALTYNNVFDTGITATPSIFWARDWSGYSIDSQFVEGRNTWAFGVKFDYEKKFAVDLAYTYYDNSAKYDNFSDRDFISLGLSTTF